MAELIDRHQQANPLLPLAPLRLAARRPGQMLMLKSPAWMVLSPGGR
ncbi:hypothetical protein [Synechococcus sp. WH 8016]|nr:hypothetical protein [Synechococcus sp. WH 8016]EHA60597.1 hypothetical protein Syn8016DRAFT_2384 [Synechococcus sp. WH 8016]NKB74782.1 hypothetical protein [Synechococcus sp. s2_metabat2_7]